MSLSSYFTVIRVLVFSFFFLVTELIQSQSEPFFMTSGRALTTSDSLLEAEKYKEAAAILAQVNENDTSYRDCLFQLGYVYLVDSNFTGAMELAKKALTKENVNHSEFYNLYGLAYLRDSQYEKSLEVYREAVEKFPMFYLYYYNMGVAYKELKQYDKALAMFKQTVRINPFYSSAYFQLGYLLGSARQTAAAAMAYHLFLMVNPRSSDADRVVGYLEKVIKNEQDWEMIELAEEGFPDYFAEIDIILNNKVALNKAYKLKTDLDFHLFRQSQALFEKIPTVKDTSFWHQCIAKNLGFIWTSGQFEMYTYYIVQDVENDAIQAQVQKKSAGLQKFNQWIREELVAEIRLRTVKNDKNYSQVQQTFYNNNLLAGTGPYESKLNIRQGTWTFYHRNSRMEARGGYDDKGKRSGKWEIYYDNGTLKEEPIYVSGDIQGEYKLYYEEGALIRKYFISREGKIEGDVELFNDFGCLSEVITFKSGLKEGSATGYYSNGKVKAFIPFKNDKRLGRYYELFPNGDTSEVGAYDVNQYYHGPFVFYYEGGQIKARGSYVAGDHDGNWAYYHENGRLQKEGSYKRNKPIGTWKEYYWDGTLKSEKNLDESGKENGDVKIYDYDGKLYEMYVYKGGIIMGYKFFDKSGKLVDSYEKKSNELAFTGYHANGQKMVEGKFDKDGRTGDWKYYNQHGLLSEDVHYVKSDVQGVRKNYHENGALHVLRNYQDDKLNGRYERRDSRGNLEILGYYVNYDAEGPYFEFSVNGDTLAKKYYREGALEGWNYYYHHSGKLLHANFNKDGFFQKLRCFDLDGKIIDSSDVTDGHGNLRFLHPNGKLSVEYQYTCGKVNGHTVFYNGIGDKLSEGLYVDEEKEGEWKWYGYHGGLETVGDYLHGSKHGRWLYYHLNGKLKQVEHYEFGNHMGVDSIFHENGLLYITEPYFFGETTGQTIFRNLNGTPYLVKDFFEDEVMAAYILHGDQPANFVDLKSGNGEVSNTYSNGTKAFACTYKNGLYDGELMAYHENGILWKKMTYVDGERENGYEEYYSNGKIKEKLNYKKGLLDGTCTYYDEQGNKIYEFNYVMGDKEGDGFFYKNGKLERKVSFFDDEILSVY